MAWAPVQENSVGNTTAANSNNLAFGSNVTAGNTLVVVCATYAQTGSEEVASGGVTDSLGNTYTRHTHTEGVTDTAASLSVHVAPNIAGGACTVTVNAIGSSTFHSFSIHEYSGIDTTTAVEAANSQRNASSTTCSSPTITSLTDNALIFAAMTHMDGTITISTAATGYTQRTEGENGATYMPYNTGDKDGGTAGSQSASWTLGSAAENIGAILALKPAAGGAAAFGSLVSGNLAARPGLLGAGGLVG